jgi:hypothetical protein
METVLSLLVAVGSLAATGWAATWSLARGRRAPGPAPDVSPPPVGPGGAANWPIDGVPALGRHDERRCAY